ncbi:hypothetical protein V1J52_24755 [Streptomyces sp. TRM 70351]|uniref:hypothetical protein n=1 Tax=Streptomyces sp. TRM 70351 TaxID=3116552 RepID=UPI002E7B1D91|nr:hypothetical protein [Streptomyces sp. TRM 70351]MEE1931333.1 hypothetical protein [Streptomyces sp. TRM 70351]
MPAALVLVLVVVALHALGTAVGGWALLQENTGKQEHGQDLLMPMGMAWSVALCCWGLAVLLAVCVVRARKRRPWVRVVFAGWLGLVAFSTLLGVVGSLASGGPSLAVLVLFGVDVSALWLVLGDTVHRWFSVRGPAPTPSRG